MLSMMLSAVCARWTGGMSSHAECRGVLGGGVVFSGGNQVFG